MKIVGINLQTSCTPGVLWKDTTGPTGVLTLTCGGSFSNATNQTILAAVAAEYPDGTLAWEGQAWQLDPGSTVVSFPDPPPGAYWVLATETAFQRNYGTFFDVLGTVTLWGLAGWGAGGIIAGAVRSHRARRYGRSA